MQLTTSPGISHKQGATAARSRSRRGLRARRWAGWLFALPALVFYGVFNFRPVLMSIQYSFYDWDGVGASTWVGLKNYTEVFTDSEQFNSLLHAFYLILFFTVLPVTLALITASVLRQLQGRFTGAVARTLLFLPQIIPGAAAGVAWTWMYSDKGVVNQFLRAIGLDSLARPWLADFTWSLTAVGFIGTWLSTGLCTMLLLAGIGKIDGSLYEAARIDGAGPIRQFLVVTLPGLRNEIGVCVTITIIAALASFDVVYLATQGGPGTQTMVPGVAVYNLAFNDNRLGAASALAVVLTLIVIAIVAPLQRLFREK
ncbi:sugar ABC transporter permease [Streptomyces cynarae]|uniref:Sugar ABC transporter permease n=1 Tax=Streptomyces cynarae TaxID=2981134 RepID=A0ABY6DYF6_9ACTN|nr:sugar ABC transporter permease [Streptomyces cynarae]UXY19434.1 sugar ABC transporter permease [Streptomyces cynarae]